MQHLFDGTIDVVDHTGLLLELFFDPIFQTIRNSRVEANHITYLVTTLGNWRGCDDHSKAQGGSNLAARQSGSSFFSREGQERRATGWLRGGVRVQARLRRVKGIGASANGGGIGRCWKAKGGMRITKATLIAITVKVFQRF